MPIHPQGARDKRILFAPETVQPPLLTGHRYIFKQSNPRYPAQFWAEIIAYHVGRTIGVEVPPAFPAWHANSKQAGALIEFFFGRSTDPVDAELQHGGDYCEKVRPGFDRKRGKLHCVVTNVEIADRLLGATMADDWTNFWARTLLFDALIGNTDRHQDNWGVLSWREGSPSLTRRRFAPAFDNGTSLAHELLEEKFSQWSNAERDAYVSRGRHHLRWNETDQASAGHFDLVARWIREYPQTRRVLRECLERFSPPPLATWAQTALPPGMTPLSPVRSLFVLDLLERRWQKLNEIVVR